MPGGRPTLKTPELVAILSDAISHGLSNEDSAAIAGISISTLYSWLEDEEFVETIRSATAQRKLTRIKMLESAEPGAWQKIAWLLERSDPLRFARPEVQIQYRLQENANGTLPGSVGPNEAALLQNLVKYKQLETSNGR
jgi:hypothetical protein